MIGATNLLSQVDKAFTERRMKPVLVPYPNQKERSFMFKLATGSARQNLKESDWSMLGHMTDNLSGSNILHVVNDAKNAVKNKWTQSKHFMTIQDPK